MLVSRIYRIQAATLPSELKAHTANRTKPNDVAVAHVCYDCCSCSHPRDPVDRPNAHNVGIESHYVSGLCLPCPLLTLAPAGVDALGFQVRGERAAAPFSTQIGIDARRKRDQHLFFIFPNSCRSTPAKPDAFNFDSVFRHTRSLSSLVPLRHILFADYKDRPMDKCRCTTSRDVV